jgi:diketogulonate reductase-like aldo/keto reductase
LVRTIGVSNYNETDLTSLLAYARVLPSINQIRYHPYNTIAQSASIQKAKKNGIVTAAYSALTPLMKEPGGAVDDVVRKIGHKEDMTDGQVILDWVKEKGILVVTTSGDPGRQAEQLEVFGKAFEDLSRKDMKRLDKAGRKQERKQM